MLFEYSKWTYLLPKFFKNIILELSKLSWIKDYCQKLLKLRSVQQKTRHVQKLAISKKKNHIFCSIPMKLVENLILKELEPMSSAKWTLFSGSNFRQCLLNFNCTKVFATNIWPERIIHPQPQSVVICVPLNSLKFFLYVSHIFDEKSS